MPKPRVRVIKVYEDHGITGTHDNRPAFQDMISDCKSKDNEIEAILVWKLSRFARKQEHSIVYQAILRKCGVLVFSVTEAVNEDTFAAAIAKAVTEVMDEWYSRNLSKDVKRGYLKLIEDGWYPFGSQSPYGYDMEKVTLGKTKRRRLKINEKEAELVREVFRLYNQENLGGTAITSKVNGLGFRTRPGRRWTKKAIFRILNNRIYMGSLVYQTEKDIKPVVFKDSHPAIISEKDFGSIQEILKKRHPKETHPRILSSSYLLTGLIKCGECGAAMTGKSAKSGKYFYYQCQTKTKQGASACNSQNAPKKEIESQIEYIIKKHILTGKNIQATIKIINLLFKRDHTEATEQRTRLVKRVGVIDHELDRCVDKIIYLDNQETTMIQAINKKVKELSAEKEKLQAKIAELNRIS